MSNPLDPPIQDPTRTSRLTKFFHSVNNGERNLKSLQDGNRYIEALCCQPDPAICIEAVVSSPAGLTALRDSVRFELSDAFLNGPASSLLSYLQKPALENLLEGAWLRQVLLSLTNTRLVWDALVRSFRKSELLPPAQASFGWLLLQLMRLPDPQCIAYYQVAQDPQIQDLFLKSNQLPLRTLGAQIKHVLSLSTSSIINDIGGCAGGRHDNDFADFRHIAILPTADELICKEPPFLRLAETLEDPEMVELRPAMHLDNQFRLYREDMLGELREEIQIALGRKKGRHRGVVLNDLKVLALDCGTEVRRQTWGLQLQCSQDFPELRGLIPKDRKPAIESNHNLLRHNSLTCLILDDEITAFPSIHRDADLLAAQPPVVNIRFIGAASASIKKTFLRLKTCFTIRLVQIDTAVFAYEPVLRGLQGMETMPLVDELLFWSPDTTFKQPPKAPNHIIEKLEDHPGEDLQGIAQTPKSIVLDKSQNSSLIATLSQRVSLVQGPPG